MKPPRTLVALTLALAFTAAACGSDSSSQSATPAEPAAAEAPSEGAVTIARSRFDAKEVTVATGSTVTFTNTDPFEHTVTANPDATTTFGSGLLAQDETFEVSFDEAGTFAYFCEIHPTMRATIVVR